MTDTHAARTLDWAAGPDAGMPTTPALARVAFAATPERADEAMPLAPLGGDLAGESWLTDQPLQTEDIAGWQVRWHGTAGWAARHLPEPGAGETLTDTAHRAYRDLFTVQRATGLVLPQRVWHVLADVIGGDGEDQRYRRFCRGRAEALAELGQDSAADWSILPPATLVGGDKPGLWMHAILGTEPVIAIENPRQVSAYAYPTQYAARPPAFARAGIATLGTARYLLISGTAAIVGHESQHAGDVMAQFDEAIANVAALLEAAAPHIGRHALTDLASLKIYVRRPADAPDLLARAAARLPGVPLVALAATVCRDELLVEVEAHLKAG